MLHQVDFFPEEAGHTPKKMLRERPTIHPTCKIIDSQIGSWTALGPNTHFHEVVFGDYSYTAGNVSISYGSVGKFCSIANSTRINPGNHPQWRVTQHHCTYRRAQYGFDTVEDEEFFQWRRDHYCVIGHDVWIGHGAVIMPGVTIGHGAIIGAGAVVTKDAGPYEVVAGIPGKVIKRRFPEHTANQLMELAWWDWDRKTLEARFREFMDLEAFIEKYHRHTKAL